ncbi:hypothetical protein ACS0TY_013085 [Phlomoides rotata]
MIRGGKMINSIKWNNDSISVSTIFTSPLTISLTSRLPPSFPHPLPDSAAHLPGAADHHRSSLKCAGRSAMDQKARDVSTVKLLSKEQL